MHAFSPVPGRQRHADCCEFETSLVYRAVPGQSPKLQRKINGKTFYVHMLDELILRCCQFYPTYSMLKDPILYFKKWGWRDTQQLRELVLSEDLGSISSNHNHL